MDKEIRDLFSQARPFDEGELCEGDEYEYLTGTRQLLYDKLHNLTSAAFELVINRVLDSLKDEIEIRCLHYFAEGYAMGKAAGQKEE